MSSFKPVAIYGLTVPAGDMPIPAFDIDEYPATFRITMAAIDPSAKPVGADALPRATLKMIRFPVYEDESDDEDDDEEDYDMANLLDGEASEEDDGDNDEEPKVNGDGVKLSAKEKKAAAIKKLKEALSSEEGMDVDEDEGMRPVLRVRRMFSVLTVYKTTTRTTRISTTERSFPRTPRSLSFAHSTPPR